MNTTGRHFLTQKVDPNESIGSANGRPTAGNSYLITSRGSRLSQPVNMNHRRQPLGALVILIIVILSTCETHPFGAAAADAAAPSPRGETPSRGSAAVDQHSQPNAAAAAAVPSVIAKRQAEDAEPVNGHQSIEDLGRGKAAPRDADDDELLLAQSQSLRDGPLPAATTRSQRGPEEEEEADDEPSAGGERPRLKIVRLFAPEAVQNATQNVTIDCMFKFDPKLDQRLTIKWFFNDELEPIYQWIPELNKRVYSDRFEHFLDKNYQLTEDVDFMLDAYKSQLTRQLDAAATPTPAADQESLLANRKLLANRLNRLAKLGSEHSKQLIGSLRKSLLMDQLEFSRFRALRLVRPTTQLNGRFTCSVSSLDGDDLQSIRLVVYEPAKSFTFNVSRANQGQQAYNLTCQAGPMFPRPNLALFRYRAAQVEAVPTPAGRADLQRALELAGQQPSHALSRPKLAATSLRQELISGTQTRLTISARANNRSSGGREPRELSIDHLELYDPDQPPAAATMDGQPETNLGDDERLTSTMQQVNSGAGSYEIVAWALVDESSLSGNLVSQFECVLTIDGANYEQRQSLSLQKGWYIHSSALSTRSTLVGLFSALASLLCLIVALVSSILIFKLLRRHANQRKIHQAKTRAQLGFSATSTRRQSGSSGGSNRSASDNKIPTADSPATTATTNSAQTGEQHEAGAMQREEIHSGDFTPTPVTPQSRTRLAAQRHSLTAAAASQQFAEFALSRASGEPTMAMQQQYNASTGHYNIPATATHSIAGQQMVTQSGFHLASSDGIYRIPSSGGGGGGENNSTFGTRFVIGGSAAAANGSQLANNANQRQWQQYYASQAGALDQQPSARRQQMILPASKLPESAAAATRQHRPLTTANNVYQSNQHYGDTTDYLNGRPLYC